MKYELKADDIYGFASAINADTRERGKELEFRHCPKCHGGSHNDEWTFSINTDTGAFCCQRSSCDYHGHFVQLCRDFDYSLQLEEDRVYKPVPQPKQKIVPKPEAIKYLESRGISAEIAEKYSITVHKKNQKVLVIPFFNPEGTELVSWKYRNTAWKKGSKGPKEWFESQTRPILFGMNNCVDREQLVITEGQMDALALAEAGVKNPVSVPGGANSSTWYRFCKDWVNEFKEIIVFGDNEHGRITLVDMMKSLFPEKPIKVVRRKDYLGEKDANDILRYFGKKALLDCVENAELPRLEVVKEIASVKDIDFEKLERIPTGFPTLDRTIGGLIFGQLVILTGKRGEGKSTFMSQLMCSCLEDKRSILVYSGELTNEHLAAWLNLQLAGKPNLDVYRDKWGEEKARLPSSVAEKIQDWYRNRAFVFDSSYMGEKEPFTDTIKKALRDYGINAIFIDNLMSAMDYITDQKNLYLAQSNFVGELKKIAADYGVVIVLIAHSRKTAAGFKEDIANDDVSGSADITNKADVVLHYGKSDTEDCDSKLQVTKNRLYGFTRYGNNAIRLRYSPLSKRVWEVGSEEKNYSWGTRGGEEDTADAGFPFV